MAPAGAPLPATTTTTIPAPPPVRRPATHHQYAIISGHVATPPRRPPPVESGRLGLAQRRPRIRRLRRVGRHTTWLPPVDHRRSPGWVRRVASTTTPPIDSPPIVVERCVPHGGGPPSHRSGVARRQRGRQPRRHVPAAAAVAAARTPHRRAAAATAGAVHPRVPPTACPSPAGGRVAAAAAMVGARIGGLGDGGGAVSIRGRRWVGRWWRWGVPVAGAADGTVGVGTPIVAPWGRPIPAHIHLLPPAWR